MALSLTAGGALAVVLLAAGLDLYWPANSLFSLARNLARPLLARIAGRIAAPALREILAQK